MLERQPVARLPMGKSTNVNYVYCICVYVYIYILNYIKKERNEGLQSPYGQVATAHLEHLETVCLLDIYFRLSIYIYICI